MMARTLQGQPQDIPALGPGPHFPSEVAHVMKVSSLHVMSVCLGLFVSSACAQDRAAADPNGGGKAGDTAPVTATEPVAPAVAPVPSSNPASAQAPEAAPGAPQIPRDPAAPAANVNGIPIRVKEVDDAVAQFLRSQGAPAGMADPRLQQMVLDGLIGRELLYQKCKADGIVPTQAEVDQVITEMKGQFPGEEAWNENLKAQGVDLAGFSALIARNLVIEKGIKQLVMDKVVIGDAEARQYYDGHSSEMTKPAEVRASHILFRVPEGAAPEAKAPIRAKASETLAKAKAGEDFAALARASSEDPGSAPNGGDLGFFKRGRMVGPFEEAAFTLPIGQVSDLVESPFGFHIIKVAEKHEASTVPYEEVSERLKGFLQQKKAREGVQALVQSLRTAAKVETF